MGTPFSDPPDQLGCVVPDLQVAISEWASKGVGPFLTMRKVTLGGYRYERRSSKPKLDVAFSQQGDLQIELIEPVNDERSAYRDFLAAGGNGAHHHGWFCNDYSAEIDAAERDGRAELQRGSWGAAHFIYYHPLAHDEMIGELIEMSDLSRSLFALIRREAEQWDGSRPSRSLLRVADWGMRWTAIRVQVGTLLQRYQRPHQPANDL
jgi:Glyoxalase/Bleomycin resistance protein/Dioxygenase superfamily